MHAAFYERTGPAAEVLQLAEVPTPTPGAGQVRVHLRWSGVNPSDVKSRAGLRSQAMPFPQVIPHSDGMGVIDAVGPGVTEARIGERVWVWNAAWGRPFGTAADYVVLPQRQAVALPEATPDEAGACLGIPALTALHTMRMAGGVEGKRVLVAGGAGAVGHYAIQFARLLGARQVIATVSSAQKAQIAREAGAGVVIDYRHEDVAARVREATEGRGVDRIVEVDIAANARLDLSVLRPGGECVVYGSGQGEFTLPFFPLIANNVSLHFFIVYHLADEDRRAAEAILHEALAAGRLVHRIDERLPLAQIAQAHEKVERGEAVGNVVLRVGNEH
ncbi:NADPH:quinone reductase [Ramlibacter rhizophilus]|uniref:NADPH:quinone reductase n=1 Tax=Ramlibacter rhizophilus TaxID=1781167 RepID=A0A4Z0BHK0_9BURK|nr:NADPH:quinone reductase [Ramlibacter rhizophilus]TFY97388.1 NADPH:quinone reductase [Ramlibacter rhizophilus]